MRIQRHDEIKGKAAASTRLPLRTWSRWFWTVIGGAAILTFFVFWRQAEIQLTKKEIELTSAQEALASVRQQVKMVQDENEAWKQKVPVLDAFGPEVTEFRVWPLRRAVGEAFEFGICPSDQCLRVRIADIVEEDGRPTVVFNLSGTWGRLLNITGKFVFSIPVVKGCTAFVRTPAVDLGVGVVDDRAAYLKLAAGIRPGTLRDAAMTIEMSKCPDSNIR